MTTLALAGPATAGWQAKEAVGNARADVECRDEAWFARLYNDTFDTVYHYARTLVRDHTTAEDVVADTYLKAWRAPLNFGGRGSALSWVMAITRNCAMDHLRARRPNVSLDLFEGIGDPEVPPTNEPWMSEEDAEAISRAVALLTPEQQDVIFMRFYQELPHDAVAAKLVRVRRRFARSRSGLS